MTTSCPQWFISITSVIIYKAQLAPARRLQEVSYTCEVLAQMVWSTPAVVQPCLAELWSMKKILEAQQ